MTAVAAQEDFPAGEGKPRAWEAKQQLSESLCGGSNFRRYSAMAKTIRSQEEDAAKSNGSGSQLLTIGNGLPRPREISIESAAGKWLRKLQGSDKHPAADSAVVDMAKEVGYLRPAP